MSLGAELVRAWSNELNTNFIGRRVRRVEGADQWIALSFGGRTGDLFFSWDSESYGCCLADEAQWQALLSMAKSKPPLFSAVKAHLMGAELIAAQQIDEDRVLSLDFSKALGAGFARPRHLIFEPSGRYSNLILLDEEEKIIEVAKHIYPETNRYRSVFPGLGYTPPPPFEGLSLEAFLAQPEASKLRSIRGIGTPLLSHLAQNTEENAPFPYAEELAAFLTLSPSSPWVYQSIGKYITLFPTLLPQAEKIATQSSLIASKGTCLLPLLNRELNKRRKKLTDLLKGRLRNVENKLKEARYLLDESASDPELPRILGTLLLSNSWQIPKGASEVTLSEWTESGEVERVIALDPLKDVSSNAKRYFERYRKQKGARLRAASILSKLEAEQEDILEQQVLVECQENPQMLILLEREITGAAEQGKKQKDKAPQLPPHRRFDFPHIGASLYVGLSAKGNHYVTFRVARGEDIWFHAQGIPGAHVILRFTDTPEEETRERCFNIAASLAGWYSKGRESGRVRVDYTQKKHVRAISGAGIANVTYREFGTILADTRIWEEEIRGLQVEEEILCKIDMPVT